MQHSADIKRQNKSALRELLLDGRSCSKRELSLQTGLSLASCNTYLNEMERTGEVVGERRKLSDVGRNSVVYRLNEDYESIVCIRFELLRGTRLLTTAVLSPTGKVRHSQTERLSVLDTEAIQSRLDETIGQFPNASRIVAGTPSVAENGVIRHSDIPELEGAKLAEILQKRYRLPVFLANDMHYKIYGYAYREGIFDRVVTMLNYPEGVLPGTATIHKGSVLTGRNLFAGMVGFLDYGIRREKLIRKMRRPEAEPFVIHAAVALISILNPHTLLFTGDLLRESDLGRIRTACLTCIPEEYMPDFQFIEDTDPYYLAGMYRAAVDGKEELP